MRGWAIKFGADFGKLDSENCSSKALVETWVNHLWQNDIDYDLAAGNELGEKLTMEYNKLTKK